MKEVLLDPETAKKVINQKMGKCLHPLEKMGCPSPYMDAIRTAFIHLHDSNNDGWPEGGLDIDQVTNDIVNILEEGNCPVVYLAHIKKVFRFIGIDLTTEEEELNSYGNR